ncbi:hypothetical protein LZF95_26335 [Algoriphagus sp. AGSA1]|nr:hypothetical protein [Algoriphagus sp. AGSA1]
MKQACRFAVYRVDDKVDAMQVLGSAGCANSLRDAAARLGGGSGGPE